MRAFRKLRPDVKVREVSLFKERNTQWAKHVETVPAFGLGDIGSAVKITRRTFKTASALARWYDRVCASFDPIS